MRISDWSSDVCSSDLSEEARRRRRSSTNRILTILKAALNVAYRNGKAPADDTWRRVRPFPKVEAPKLRYLQENEARRLVNACDQAFRSLVQAALLTGARYAELAALEVRDYEIGRASCRERVCQYV